MSRSIRSRAGSSTILRDLALRSRSDKDAMDAKGLKPSDLSGIGITNQRETTVVVE